MVYKHKYFLMAFFISILFIIIISGCSQPATLTGSGNNGIGVLLPPDIRSIKLPADIDSSKKFDGVSSSSEYSATQGISREITNTTDLFASTVYHLGTDVMVPMVHWYFNSNANAPSGFYYKCRYWYYASYCYPDMGTDGWYQLETHTWITNLGYEYENHIFDRMPAFYENGVVEVWLVNPSNGIEIYLGYVQETVWQMVRTISD